MGARVPQTRLRWYRGTMSPNDLLHWFDEIEKRGLGSPSDDGMGQEFYSPETALRWVADAESALHQVFPPEHPVRKQWAERLAGAKGQEWLVRETARVDALRAIFSSAAGQLRAGRLSTLADGIRAEDANELLDQADALTAAGHHLAGAVVAGGALETVLRHLCSKYGIVPAGNGSIAKYQQSMATSRKAGTEVISTGDEKQVLAWGDFRNEAAHTPLDFLKNRTAPEVSLMIIGLRGFVAKYT